MHTLRRWMWIDWLSMYFISYCFISYFQRLVIVTVQLELKSLITIIRGSFSTSPFQNVNEPPSGWLPRERERDEKQGHMSRHSKATDVGATVWVKALEGVSDAHWILRSTVQLIHCPTMPNFTSGKSLRTVPVLCVVRSTLWFTFYTCARWHIMSGGTTPDSMSS